MLAPVGHLDWDESTNNHLVVKENIVHWYYSNEIFRTFTMDEQVSHATLTHFNSVLCVVINCNDLVYTYSSDGRVGCTGLQFSPETMVACESGVVFMFKKKLYIMTDPQKLVGLVIPSSTTSIDSDDRLIYFGEKNISVALLQNKRQVKILHSRRITPRITQKQKRVSSIAAPRRHSSLANQLYHDARIMSGASDGGVLDKLHMPSLSDIEFEKEAIVSHVTTIEFKDVPTLQVSAQRFSNQQAIYLLDKSSNELHVLTFSNDSKVPLSHDTRQVKGFAKVEGFKIGNTIYPAVVLLGQDMKLYLYSAFFQLSDLQVDFGPPCVDVQEGSDNSFIVETQDRKLHRLFLVTDLNSDVVQSCFQILEHLLEPVATMHWLITYQGVYQLMPNESSWSVFFITAIACLCHLDIANSMEDGSDSWVHVVNHVQTSFERISFDHITSMIIICFHLLREEYLLDAHSDDNVDNLGLLLSFLTHHAGWHDWTEYYGYEQDLQFLLDAIPEGYSFILPAEKIYAVIPSIFATLVSLIAPPYTEYPQITSLKALFYRSLVCQSLFECLSGAEVSVEHMVELLNRLQLTQEKINNFAEGVRVAIMEIVCALQTQKLLDIETTKQYQLLGRRDLEVTASPDKAESAHANATEGLGETDSPQDDFLTLVFDKDRRYRESRRLLDASIIHESGLTQPNELSDHDWIEMQFAVQWVHVIRTLSLAFGQAAMFFSSETPFISERIPLPLPEFKLLLTETNVHASFDVKRMPDQLMYWGWFHQGIAVGMKISKDAQNVTGSWIVYNKPQTEGICLRHAGFLLGLGINGHLHKLEEWHTYNYIGGKEPITSIALLLGIPASHLGSMDSKLTKVLSVHVSALLPKGSNDLNVRPDVRTAAVIGVGLLYFNSKDRRMTEVFLAEICCDDPKKDEFYRYASGLSLGLINLAKGPQLNGLVDSQLTERLEQIATHVTDDIRRRPYDHMSCNGATIALMLIFLQSNNKLVAEKLSPPTSRVLATYGRPDLLFTRSMAHHLIMWDEISNADGWIRNMVPQRLLPTDKILRTDKLPYLNILGGITTAMCLRYAGTQDNKALNSALAIIDELIEWTEVELDESGVEIVGKSKKPDLIISLANVNFIIASVAMAAASIVVSSGNLELLKRLRYLHGRGLASLPMNSIYNLNVGVSQAIGMLFLGGSQYSFDQTPKSIAFLALSVGNLASAGREVINWQLLRYFWAFTARKSSVILRDVTSNTPIKASISVSDGKELINLSTPALVPCDAKYIEFTDPEYLPLRINLDTDHSLTKAFIRSRTIYIQKKASKPLPDTLEKWLVKDEHDMEMTRSISSTVKYLNIMSQNPDKRASYMWNLKLLFTFTDFWSHHSNGLSYIPSREVDMFKLNVWRARKNKKSSHS